MADDTQKAQENALHREVDDDLREEQMMMLWKRFGSYIIGVAVLIVVIVAGYQGWKQYDLSNRTTQGDSFYSATLLAKSGNIENAIQAFGQLSKESTAGYATLAGFQQAALMAANGDTTGAAVLYKDLAKSNSNDVAMGGLANVLGAMLEINTGGYDVAAMTMRLESISGDDHPYRYSARELLGLVFMGSGDSQKALENFTKLSKDTATPNGIRTRATNLIKHLGG